MLPERPRQRTTFGPRDFRAFPWGIPLCAWCFLAGFLLASALNARLP